MRCPQSKGTLRCEGHRLALRGGRPGACPAACGLRAPTGQLSFSLAAEQALCLSPQDCRQNKRGDRFRSAVQAPQWEHCAPSLPRRLPAPPHGPGQFCHVKGEKEFSDLGLIFKRFKHIFNGRATECSHRIPESRCISASGSEDTAGSGRGQMSIPGWPPAGTAAAVGGLGSPSAEPSSASGGLEATGK